MNFRICICFQFLTTYNNRKHNSKIRICTIMFKITSTKIYRVYILHHQSTLWHPPRLDLSVELPANSKKQRKSWVNERHNLPRQLWIPPSISQFTERTRQWRSSPTCLPTRWPIPLRWSLRHSTACRSLRPRPLASSLVPVLKYTIQATKHRMLSVEKLNWKEFLANQASYLCL